MHNSAHLTNSASLIEPLNDYLIHLSGNSLNKGQGVRLGLYRNTELRLKNLDATQPLLISQLISPIDYLSLHKFSALATYLNSDKNGLKQTQQQKSSLQLQVKFNCAAQSRLFLCFIFKLLYLLWNSLAKNSTIVRLQHKQRSLDQIASKKYTPLISPAKTDARIPQPKPCDSDAADDNSRKRVSGGSLRQQSMAFIM